MIIQKNIPLHDKNWFGTGGAARFFAEPTTVQEFQEALSFAHQNKLEIFVLGKGANVLISDDGFDGLVIRPRLETIEVVPFEYFNRLSTNGDKQSLSSHEKHSTNPTKKQVLPFVLQSPVKLHAKPGSPSKSSTGNKKMPLVTAGAGTCLDTLIEFCLDNNLLGLEEFSGIPGTVGGAVFINLHYFEFLLNQFLVVADIINKKTGKITSVNKQWFSFGYNDSALHNHEYYLLNATFALKSVNDLEVAYARGRRLEIIRHRTARYPTSNTCGSFFRNFHNDEVILTSNGKKMIYVAYYLDKIGVKGQLTRGDALVSYQHANMIVNKGSAKTNDIINVAQEMQRSVKKHFNIIPQPECRLIGFSNYPLL